MSSPTVHLAIEQERRMTRPACYGLMLACINQHVERRALSCHGSMIRKDLAIKQERQMTRPACYGLMLACINQDVERRALSSHVTAWWSGIAAQVVWRCGVCTVSHDQPHFEDGLMVRRLRIASSHRSLRATRCRTSLW